MALVVSLSTHIDDKDYILYIPVQPFTLWLLLTVVLPLSSHLLLFVYYYPLSSQFLLFVFYSLSYGLFRPTFYDCRPIGFLLFVCYYSPSSYFWLRGHHL